MSSVLQDIPPLVEKRTSRLTLLRSSFRRHRMAYLMLVPGITFFLIFSYYPMYGLIISFKDFKGSLGILGSPWVGLKHFQVLFASEESYRVFRNTLLLNEIGRSSVKRPIQTILYFPHFLSWVVVGGIVYRVLGFDGVANRSTQLEFSMKIVSGKLELEAGWSQMQQALKDGGIEKVQAAYQKWYDAKVR